MFANQQVQIGIIGHAVAFVGRFGNLNHPVSRHKFAPGVARHVGKDQVLLNRVPQRTFGKNISRSDLAYRLVLSNQVPKTVIFGDMTHLLFPFRRLRHRDQTGNQSRLGNVSTSGPGTTMPVRPTT